MKCRTLTSLVLFLTLSACRAGSVEINDDEGDVLEDGSDMDDSSAPDQDSDEEDDDDRDDEDDDDRDDEDDDDDWDDDDDDDDWDDDDDDWDDDDDDWDDDVDSFSGEVEITFTDSGSLFCAGEAEFGLTEEKVWGEGNCVLQAGPGAGEVIDLEFEVGRGEDGFYDGVVVSDWEPPEGDGMLDADYSAKLYSGTLYVNWATRVPVPDSDQAMTVEGAVVAGRD